MSYLNLILYSIIYIGQIIYKYFSKKMLNVLDLFKVYYGLNIITNNY